MNETGNYKNVPVLDDISEMICQLFNNFATNVDFPTGGLIGINIVECEKDP